MTPEAEAHLGRARIELKDAERACSYGLDRLAARAAYYAAFRAAEALIVERTGKVAKTHRGVRSESARLWRDVPWGGSDLVSVIARGHALKDFADYGMGSPDEMTPGDATAMIEAAADFVRRISEELARSPA